MSLKRLRELFMLSPAQQIRHWAGHDPWEDMKLDNKTEVGVNAVLLDGDWNITRMPLLLKPCFGQPTAFVRHGGHQPIRNPRFGVVPSRCMRCKAKEACEQVAKRRVRATPEIKEAFIRFDRAGGVYGLKNPSDCPTAERDFRGWVSALVTHGGFKSSNDAAALAQLDVLEQAARAADAERNRLARRKGIKSGDLDADFLALMKREAEDRAASLTVASLWDGMPPKIAKIQNGSAAITADVWLVRECMLLRGQAINPSSVAHQLARLDAAKYPPAKHNSLRQRVGTDLARVELLERFVPKGHIAPIWPRFKLKDALDKLDMTTPYTS